jgi:hypothetical protein
MAVALTITYPAGTSMEAYDKVLEALDLDSEGSHDNGALFHWAEDRNGQLVVHDVWESREDFDSFAADVLGPASQETGMPAPVNIQETPVYNYLTA